MRGGRTHTKKKRVQTWSETGQTQMLPCFCRSLEVMTAEGRKGLSGGGQVANGHRDVALGTPGPPRCPAREVGAARPPPPHAAPHLHKARCSSGCGSGGSGTGWSGSAGRAQGVTPCPAAVPDTPPAPSLPFLTPTAASPAVSPGGWCSSGCTSAPAHPLKASGAALSPSLRKATRCRHSPPAGHPRGMLQPAGRSSPG